MITFHINYILLGGQDISLLSPSVLSIDLCATNLEF